MSRTVAAAGGDPDHRPDPGPDRAPLLPRPERLDRRDRRPTLPPLGGLSPAVPGLVRAGPVPLQAEQPPPARLPVQRRRPGGPAQPQPPGGHGAGASAGEPDL